MSLSMAPLPLIWTRGRRAGFDGEAEAQSATVPDLAPASPPSLKSGSRRREKRVGGISQSIWEANEATRRFRYGLAGGSRWQPGPARPSGGVQNHPGKPQKVPVADAGKDLRLRTRDRCNWPHAHAAEREYLSKERGGKKQTNVATAALCAVTRQVTAHFNGKIPACLGATGTDDTYIMSMYMQVGSRPFHDTAALSACATLTVSSRQRGGTYTTCFKYRHRRRDNTPPSAHSDKTDLHKTPVTAPWPVKRAGPKGK